MNRLSVNVASSPGLNDSLQAKAAATIASDLYQKVRTGNLDAAHKISSLCMPLSFDGTVLNIFDGEQKVLAFEYIIHTEPVPNAERASVQVCSSVLSLSYSAASSFAASASIASSLAVGIDTPWDIYSFDQTPPP